jgi:hypothetical protein
MRTCALVMAPGSDGGSAQRLKLISYGGITH